MSQHPLRNRQFAKLLGYRCMLVMSYQILMVVVGWHLYQITHDTLSLGLVGLAEIIPYFATALFAGYAVDHYSKRNFAVLSGLIMLLSACILANIAEQPMATQMPLWIYSCVVLVGFGRAFIAPSYSAMFAAVLPRNQFAEASSLGSSAFQIGLVLGPAVGGLLVGYLSIDAAYWVAGGFGLAAALTLLSLPIVTPKNHLKPEIFKGIAAGLGFVFRHQIVLSALALDMFAVLFGGAIAMLPAFIHDIYLQGPESLGILRASPAVGAILTSLYLAHRPIREHAGKRLLWAVAGFGACMIAFALSKNFWLAAAILMLSGMLDGISVVLRSTIIQLATPDHMRGRVASINGLFIGSSNELGAFESGVAARLLGLVPSVIFGGAMTLLVVAYTAVKAPKLRQLNLYHLEQEH
jgi:MFS family permease